MSSDYQFPRRREFVCAGKYLVPQLGDVLTRGGEEWEVVHVEIDERGNSTLELRPRAKSVAPYANVDSAMQAGVIHATARAAKARADADARRTDAEARRDRADAERAEVARRTEIGRSRSS